MFTVDVQSRTPVWEQIAAETEKYILLGLLKPDDKLPSVREMAMSTGVNPNTIIRAYADLTHRGLIVAAGGRGYFVSKDVLPSLKKAAEAKLPEFEALTKNLVLSGIEKEKLKNIIDNIN